jgi:hypothetical protein
MSSGLCARHYFASLDCASFERNVLTKTVMSFLLSALFLFDGMADDSLCLLQNQEPG